MSTKPIMLSAAIFCTAPAMAQLSDTAGISGEVSLSAGYLSSTSNFNTDANATITDNTQKGESDSNVMPLPLGSVAYTFGSQLDKQFYVGTSREDIAVGTLALELGYKQQLANGTVIDASFLPTIMSGETWADPFKTGSDRSETDETGNAFRVKLSNINNSGFSLDTAYASQEVENERSGLDSGYASSAQLLKRDADKLYLKGDYRLRIDQATFLAPSITFVKSDAEGDAYSYNSWGGELSLFKVIERHQFALTAGYTHFSYDASHPVYNTTRSDDEFSLFAAYEYKQFMDLQDWSLISFAGYGQSDSNINFYDEQQLLFSVGMNYKF
ncbi:DUF2860 domain-containing protein [Vibrio brasiliensis]|uniref:DUF2860 domain-containing protein n=1 Tax=Vibrio brasiliensis TaxID=170652 RepID=UPI001EFD47E4|nr:DUF2860 domain-containing protein [Vibrio brasiliensis]MCG9650991.1 DUF2860 domain-containing protein [Vibrio brasiliensis]